MATAVVDPSTPTNMTHPVWLPVCSALPRKEMVVSGHSLLQFRDTLSCGHSLLQFRDTLSCGHSLLQFRDTLSCGCVSFASVGFCVVVEEAHSNGC